jgi:hypothetical protein
MLAEAIESSHDRMLVLCLSSTLQKVTRESVSD